MSKLTYITKTDVLSPTLMYVGRAVTGSLTSDSVWKIAKVDTDAAGSFSITIAQGYFTNKWDDRYGLTYA